MQGEVKSFLISLCVIISLITNIEKALLHLAVHNNVSVCYEIQCGQIKRDYTGIPSPICHLSRLPFPHNFFKTTQPMSLKLGA